MKLFRSPRFLVAAAMAIFGTIPLFVKYIPLPSGEIALYRTLMAVVLVGIYLFITKNKISLGDLKGHVAVLLVSSVALGANWIFLFEAYKYTTVSTATLSYYMAPVIVTVLSPVFFKERVTTLQIVCFIMSTAGLVLITGIGGAGKNDIIGIALGLAAACLYATVVLANKRMRNIDGIKRTFLQFAVASAILIPYVSVTGGFNLTSLDGRGIAALVTVGAVHTGVTYCMYFSGLGGLSGQSASMLSYIDPMIAVLISVFILSEEITPLQIIGGIFILGFSVLNELAPYIVKPKCKNK
ncbi:MAG: EamA family transporter [Clostridia bacterium]|nr:EamA family transporter [Clostridia bacterium]